MTWTLQRGWEPIRFRFGAAGCSPVCRIGAEFASRLDRFVTAREMLSCDACDVINQEKKNKKNRTFFERSSASRSVLGPNGSVESGMNGTEPVAGDGSVT